MKTKRIARISLLAALAACVSASQLSAMPTEQAFALLAQNLGAAAKQHQLNDVAVLPFMANGKMSNEISEELRDLAMEKLLGAQSLSVYDRNEMSLVATESSISCPEGAAATANSFLIAEIFYAKGDPVGYLSYRLIQTSNSQVVAAGFVKLDWDEAQRGLLSGADRTVRANQLPLLSEKEGETVAQNTSAIHDNIAMVYDGSDTKDNTLAARMAFAQVQAWMVASGHAVFEREFLRSTATEESLNDGVANSGDNITTVGHIKLKKKDDSASRVTLQFFALADHKLLSTFSLTQDTAVQEVAAQQGDDGENALNLRRKNRLKAQTELTADVKLVQHVEYVLNDNEMKACGQVVDKACDVVEARFPNLSDEDKNTIIKYMVEYTLCQVLKNYWEASIYKEFGLEVPGYLLRGSNGPSPRPENALHGLRDASRVLQMIRGSENCVHSERGYITISTRIGSLISHPMVNRSFDWKNGVPCKVTIDTDFTRNTLEKDEVLNFFRQLRSN